jgi:5-methylcytosine-specific restriction endonuclease McrA|uniref:NinG recombination protein n=1 Tax=Myoviridae sp. ctqfO1 TaxID=2827710 RepID=A0A8S5T287_9CAUD|nr:MAG TPA: NinG recombination protein [Myoviridae sp. ctqfO1]
MVYVISKEGQPIMPTENHAKVRLLLKSNKARVVKRTPFTIQLVSTSKTYTQEITLGVDAGSKHVGLSASTEKKELFAAELRPRNDVVNLMSSRRELRRSRRSRTTRYRQARFLNRIHSKHKGWLAPSVEVKIWNHIQGIKLITKLLPIKTICIETAEFDLQRLKALEAGEPIPVGKDYQLGEMYGHYNVRQYVLHRDGYSCQCCGAHSTDKKKVKLHVHHLETRKTGGNAPDNLITLCEDCHTGYHAGTVALPTTKRKRRSTRDATFMGIMRKTLIERLHNMFLDINICSIYGYITKYWREKKNITKTHISDAFVIAKNLDAERLEKALLIVPKRQHNRQIHKCKINKGGTRKMNQTPKFVFGYQLFDRVMCLGQEGFIFARRSSGSFDIRKLNGEKIKPNINYKKLKHLESRKALLVSY